MMPRQYALPFATPRDLSESRFIVAPSNAEAWEWLGSTPDWPLGRLALFGPEGAGKSHLAAIWAARTGARIARGEALRFEGPADGPLAVDDADLAPERDLLHSINAQAEAGHPLLLVSRAPPARWHTALPDLASRLRATATAELHEADDDLLRRLLARLLAEYQLRVPEEMQDWLHLRLPRTQAAMQGAAARLHRLTMQLGTGVTWPVARAVLAAADDSFAGTSHHQAGLL